MSNNITLIAVGFFMLFGVNSTQSQTKANLNVPYYINVFINEDFDIWVESEIVPSDKIKNAITEIIYNKPFKVDEFVVYRLYADSRLNLGDIINIEDKLFNAYNYNTKRERYLLDTVKLNIDGSNWLDEIKKQKIKPY